MIADIAHGETGAADIFFLVAVILAVLAALLAWRPPEQPFSTVAGWLALACASMGWLLL
jgi:hypothetical protein